jgi:transposase
MATQGSHLPLDVKATIVGMLDPGASDDQVCNDFLISRASAYRLLNKFHSTGTLARQEGSGRPRATNATQYQAICACSRELFGKIKHKQLALVVNYPPDSDETIRKRLAEDSQKARKPAAKEVLTETHRQNRLNFAIAYVNKGPDF